MLAVLRSNRREVRNPVLALPAARRLLKLHPEVREILADLFGEMASDCRFRAQESWRRNKGPMAAYWKAAGAYANHIRHVLRSATDRFTKRLQAAKLKPPTHEVHMDAMTRAALERLTHAANSDTGQARRVANFLLAWWNAGDLGGFDLTDLWNVDEAISRDMVRVFNYLAGPGQSTYPDDFREDFASIIHRWRPHVIDDPKVTVA